MDFVWKLYGNMYAVGLHVTVALVGVATLNLALPPPPDHAVYVGPNGFTSGKKPSEFCTVLEILHCKNKG